MVYSCAILSGLEGLLLFPFVSLLKPSFLPLTSQPLAALYSPPSPDPFASCIPDRLMLHEGSTFLPKLIVLKYTSCLRL